MSSGERNHSDFFHDLSVCGEWELSDLLSRRALHLSQLDSVVCGAELNGSLLLKPYPPLFHPLGSKKSVHSNTMMTCGRYEFIWAFLSLTTVVMIFMVFFYAG